MDIQFDYFSEEAEVLAEIEAAGYFPLALDFAPDSNEDHWHDFDSLVYILEGEIKIIDSRTGESCVCGKGTKIVASHGVLHREETAGHRAMIGFSVDPSQLTQPVNKPPPVV